MLRKRTERGQGSLESLGVIAVAGLLVAALSTAVIHTNPSITGSVQDGICKVVTLGEGECNSAPEIRADEDYVPPEPCVIGATGEETGGSFSIAVVKIEGGDTWIVEDLGDGRSRLTRSTDAGVGLTAGVGIDFTVTADGTKIGLAASASASAMLAGAQGDVFYADNPEQAQAILEGQESDDSKDFWWGDSGPARWVADEVGGTSEYENTEPEETWSETGMRGDAHAGATLLWGTAEANVAEEAYLGTTTRRDGTTTGYFRGTLSGDAGVDIGVANAGIEGEMEALIEVDRDEDGNPIAMRIISTLSGTASADDTLDDVGAELPEYTTTTIQIPLETEEQRDVASRVLWATGIPFMPGVSDGITDADAIGTPFEIPQIGQDLGQLANESGHMWKETYTVDTSENGYDVGFKAGVELGASGTWNNTSQSLTDYRYWDGSQWATRPGCTA